MEKKANCHFPAWKSLEKEK